jgi:hypothetical protein
MYALARTLLAAWVRKASIPREHFSRDSTEPAPGFMIAPMNSHWSAPAIFRACDGIRGNRIASQCSEPEPAVSLLAQLEHHRRLAPVADFSRSPKQSGVYEHYN